MRHVDPEHVVLPAAANNCIVVVFETTDTPAILTLLTTRFDGQDPVNTTLLEDKEAAGNDMVQLTY